MPTDGPMVIEVVIHIHTPGRYKEYTFSPNLRNHTVTDEHCETQGMTMVVRVRFHLMWVVLCLCIPS